MKTVLPANLVPYKRTPAFDDSTMPAGLLAEHSIKEGVWGLIHVEKGKLRYLVTDPRRATTDEVLAPNTAPGLVEPTILHRVEPIGTVTFHVEFLRVPQHGTRKIDPTDHGERS